MRLALEEVSESAGNVVQMERGWKLFLLLPRMLLHRHPRGGLVSKAKLSERFDKFVRGEWNQLIRASMQCDEEAAVSRRRKGRRSNDSEQRAIRALNFVQVGELSAARQALEGAEIAPGNDDTLKQLSDTSKRPDRLRDPIPPEVMEYVPTMPFELDETMFLKNVRSAKRGIAGGPSGMTVEHLRPLLESSRDHRLFCTLAESMARGMLPQPIVEAIRLGRMTALRKNDGGVRGIVTGDVVRRLVARTMAQQMGKTVESATAPFQYALSTRAGCECIAHALQGLCDVDPNATIISIDGISAYDQISRAAMMDGLLNVAGGGKALPFVKMFYGSPSSYVWEDSEGVTHTIRQGEGGEQGDPFMPLLFSLGQHSALEAVQEDLFDGEFLFAFLDDIYVATTPHRVEDVYKSLDENLWSFSRIQIHGGKTKVWNAIDDRPEFCDILEVIARRSDPHARVWRGSNLPVDQQGIKILGTPLGHPHFVEAHLNRKSAEHDVLLERIPTVPDLQSAWALLLHCASARANYLLRVVKPAATKQFAKRHNEGLWKCLCRPLAVGSRAEPRSKSGSVNAIESGRHGVERRCQSGCPSVLG